MPKDR